MRINRGAADESRRIQKVLALRVQDLVRGQNLEAAREAVLVHVPPLAPDRDHYHDLVPDLDLHLDPDLEASRDLEAALHLDQGRDLPKVDHDQGRAREKAVHGQGLTVVRGKADRNQDQDQGRARERVALGRGHRAVQGKPHLDRSQGQNQDRDLNLDLDLDLDLEAARAQVQRNGHEAKADHDQGRSPFRDLNQNLKVPADHDRVLDQRAALEVEVPVDQHGKLLCITMAYFSQSLICSRNYK